MVPPAMAPSELATATGGAYRILARAGEGGSAEVFHAVDLASGREVALKCALSDAVVPALAAEANHAALALSPRLPELHDVGWIVDPRGGERRAYLALRWIEGQPVDPRRPADHAARLEQAHAIGFGLAVALADLHAIGTAHGDVKPANVIVDHAGGAHLIDLGLATPAHATSVLGATLRYLARADADLGDARARDLLALGVVISELADEVVASSSDPIAASRAARRDGVLETVCSALLAPGPAARPSAAWVAEMLAGGSRAAEGETSERHVRAVRASYLRVRREELVSGGVASDEVAPWMAEALGWTARVRSLTARAGDPHQGPAVGRATPEQIARWLTALVGSAAAGWSVRALTAIPEPDLARALAGLARARSPRAWTFRDIEASLSGRASSALPARQVPSRDAGTASRVALALARVPADPEALAEVEVDQRAPSELVVAAADALRLQGELGRARALVLRGRAGGDVADAGLVADILRRSGDPVEAEKVARSSLAADPDRDPRARAVLARILLDRGELGEAEAVATAAEQAPSALLSEVMALVASARGDSVGALAWVERGDALATEPEERARLAGVRGYVILATDPNGARVAFGAAVDHAVRAGAVIEEATYRTGEAAAAVDLGDLGRGIETARRAALLWEHLGRPSQASRALLAVAAAYGTAGAEHDAVRAAEEAIGQAREANDARAEVYALWAIADVSAAASPRGRAAATLAMNALSARPGDATANVEDTLRASARLLRHGALPPERITDLDRVVMGKDGGALPAAARLDWWGARALAGAAAPMRAEVLGALLGLAEVPASLGARARALAAGVDLATQAGQGDAAQRLLSTLGDLARQLVASVPESLKGAVRALPWVERAGGPVGSLGTAQARDLEVLIRGLGDSERLPQILNRIVDALVLWTGVERGLLLMRAPDGKLVPRAARNLARADLVGEQMALSESLARRALAAREPVVAVDATGELGDLHKSVHALKLRSVLAVPLITRGEVLGVAYLDDRIRRGAFGPREIEWARTIASLAAMVIADARDQVLLRRAARRAKRASEAIAETLSLREAALGAAERELVRARSGRDTRFPYAAIVGESPAVRAMLRLVDRVTASEIAVLIAGESGSGKELVARAIHENGARASRPFVTENCGAISEALLESELFGHVRGAFTGADRPRAGLFEVADQGTLFLDEIGEMSLGMQTRLLRVLEDGVVRPVGSDRERKVNVRLIAATNRDLAAMVKERQFREDLFYRLDVISIRVPPLRERAEDIPLLVHHFVETLGEGRGARVTSAAMDRLVAFAWPGNVRQLQNEVRRALLLSEFGAIDETHLSPEIAGDGAAEPRETGLHLRRRVDQLERRLVTEAMDRTGQNQTQAAKLLGVSRFGLQKMMKRLAVD